MESFLEKVKDPNYHMNQSKSFYFIPFTFSQIEIEQHVQKFY